MKENEYDEDIAIFPISSVTHKGINALMSKTADLLENTQPFPVYDEIEEEEESVLYKYTPEEKPYTLTREPDASWTLGGAKLIKLFQMTNFDHDESALRFARQLRSMGVDAELRERGAKNGDIVRMKDQEFEFEYLE